MELVVRRTLESIERHTVIQTQKENAVVIVSTVLSSLHSVRSCDNNDLTLELCVREKTQERSTTEL